MDYLILRNIIFLAIILSGIQNSKSQNDFNTPTNPYLGGNRNDQTNTYLTNQISNVNTRKYDAKTSYNSKNQFLDAISKQTTYFVVASKTVRPGLIYHVSVSILYTVNPVTVHASISRNGVEISGESKEMKEGIQETLSMRIPSTSVTGNYKLRVEGLYNNVLGGIAFLNETNLDFLQRSMTIFIQTDKPLYMQNEIVRFRIIPITTELKGFNSAIDVYMIDPNGVIVRRWLSRQSNIGSVSLDYQLSDQPSYGEWTIRIIAQGQIEEGRFLVEEFYQTRFEVNVTMPSFFFYNDKYIYGKIMANFTSGAPVNGNLTLKATVRQIGWFDTKKINERYRLGHHFSNYIPRRYYGYNSADAYGNQQYGNQQYGNTYGTQNYDNYGSQNYDGYGNQFYQTGNQGDNYNQFGNINPTDTSSVNPQDQDYYSRQNQYMFEKYFEFDENWPFWIQKPYTETYDRWTGTYKNSLPYLRFFNGTYEFRYPMQEILQLLPDFRNGVEIMFTATVGEKFYDEIISGYAITRIYNSTIKLQFLGDSPQVFKPEMPHTCYIVAAYHDGSPLRTDQLYRGQLSVAGYVEGLVGGRRDFPTKILKMSENSGVWELLIDLRYDLNIENNRNGEDVLTNIQTLKLEATFNDGTGEFVRAELMLLSHYSPKNRHIKINTSTKNAKVGEYAIFHVRTNFFMETFSYLVISKGIILVSGEETITEGIRTMAIACSSEMAPVATIVVWKVNQYGYVVADSLTFPVNGISRNNFTVYINNRKARTGEKVEVAIYGDPGSFVGLSGIDNAFYTMQAGNELSYADIIKKMSNFGEEGNGTYAYTWRYHEGTPDRLVYYPASSFGIDANRTFGFNGLIVFTDSYVPRRYSNCDFQIGTKECLSGNRCYDAKKECDGYYDCDDGTDEMNCNFFNETALNEYRKYRFNRMRRHYENVWLWKDINIGPHGRYIFNIDVPDIPALWMVSAFSLSGGKGFGMLHDAIEYIGVQPFYINLEMPSKCRQGEQVGLRVTVFNYMTTPVECTVVLHGSPDYKFIHVEEDGIVRSYNPRTSHGEHQFFIYLKSQESSTVYIPIVPTRLGEIEVTVHAGTLLGTDTLSRKLLVEPDGLTQNRHQSILLDLSNRAYVLQYMHVNITETPIIPYQVERYYVFGSNRARLSVVGDVVGPIFPTMPVNSTSLLNLPMESAEQNMYSFATNLYTILYMRLINQRNKVLEKHGFHHLNIGLQRQLSYLRPDGSFSLFRSDWNNSASSVWLTAYCARVFQEASFYEWENFIFIDPLIIQNSIRWILQHQTPEGSFYEVTSFPDRKMNTSYFDLNENSIKFKNITLTAHVLITLASSKDLSGSLGSQVALAQQRAIIYIERNMEYLSKSQEPHELAIVAYALMLSRSTSAEQVFSYLAKHARYLGEFVYWGREEVPLPPTKLENQKYFSLPRLPYEFDSLNIETTAYALLVYVSRREFFVDPIARWLNAQRLTDGGWASTQDSAIALKALIEYTVHSRLREVSSLSVTVEATSLPGETKVLTINDANFGRPQFIDIPNAWGTVRVQAKGAGYAILQMHVQYTVDIERFQTKPPVPAFSLVSRAIFQGRNQSHILYKTCQSWVNVNESDRSGLTVLDVTIPTGYYIQQQKLDKYVLSRNIRNLQRAKYIESDSKVLFYFQYLDRDDVCVDFTVERWYPVANMSRYLPIRVYDYYAPERFNETIFDSLPTYLLNICEVCGSSQCPYCTIYNSGWTVRLSSFILLITFVRLLLFR
ncbi:CD109 antigen [Condylostylus longicornis]|uniref:CD109 antigen n=1 Tax=Condylostylus longicornis TaxID=2530218 RepID=UPI00244E5684|nr:CD109 antigen [Condylostylus longicornis]